MGNWCASGDLTHSHRTLAASIKNPNDSSSPKTHCPSMWEPIILWSVTWKKLSKTAVTLRLKSRRQILGFSTQFCQGRVQAEVGLLFRSTPTCVAGVTDSISASIIKWHSPNTVSYSGEKRFTYQTGAGTSFPILSDNKLDLKLGLNNWRQARPEGTIWKHVWSRVRGEATMCSLEARSRWDIISSACARILTLWRTKQKKWSSLYGLSRNVIGITGTQWESLSVWSRDFLLQLLLEAQE